MVILILQRLFPMRLPVGIDLFIQFLCVVFCCVLRRCDLLELLVVGMRFYVRGINEDRRSVHNALFHALHQDLLKNLLEQICSCKSAGVILAERGEMGNGIVKVQAQEPAIGQIHFDLFDRLAHTLDPKQVLNECDLEKDDRIDARSSIVLAVFIFDQVIDETEVDHCIDFSKQMVLWNEFFKGYDLHLRRTALILGKH